MVFEEVLEHRCHDDQQERDCYSGLTLSITHCRNDLNRENYDMPVNTVIFAVFAGNFNDTYLEYTQSQEVEICELGELREEISRDKGPPGVLGRSDFVI